MIINRSYFEGEIKIPNANAATHGTGETLDIFIEIYEDELLNDILGYSFYKAFKAGLAADPIDQRWIDLRDGKEFTIDTNCVELWRGMTFKATEAGQMQSFIANYIYYRYMAHNSTQTSASGEKKSKSENSVDASPVDKMIRAWNAMSNWIMELMYFLDKNKTVYPEWRSQTMYEFIRKYRRNNAFGI